MAMRMRTTLLLSLLAVSFGLTALSLIVIHTSLQGQIRQALASDLHRCDPGCPILLRRFCGEGGS